MNTTVKVPPRERLSAERLRRRWSQLEVADRLGTTPGNVSRWERGITSPGPYFRRKLCELFGMSAQELGLTPDESPGRNPHPSAPVNSSFLWDTPPRGTPSLPDREDLLAHILLRPGPSAGPSISASSDPAELNLPAQECADRGRLVQTITHWLQTRPNLVLILDNAETVVIVAPKENGC